MGAFKEIYETITGRNDEYCARVGNLERQIAHESSAYDDL
jgi:hypothetical protein